MNGEEVLQKIMTEVFSPLYELAVGIAFVYFMYGAFRYIVDMNNPEKKNFGRSHLLWGLVGLFIILSVGGILKLFDSIFGSMFTF